MFTGLIEDLGTIRSLSKEGSGFLLTVSSSKITDGISIGDSIAIDGACQTAVSFDSKNFSVFVSEVFHIIFI